MFARILSLLVGLAVVGAACLSNPTPHPGRPRPHEADPNHVGTVVDPGDDQKTNDLDPTMTNPTGAWTDDCDSDKYESADAGDATADAGGDAVEDAQPTPEGDTDEAGCDAATATSDTGPDAASPGAAEFGQVHDP